MPGLPLVDDVDLTCLLLAEQQGLQRGPGAELGEPGHLDVHGVAHAVRAGQRRGVAQGAEPPLVLDAAGQAGHPQRRGPRPGLGGQGRGQLVQQQHRFRAGAGEAQARGARHPVRL